MSRNFGIIGAGLIAETHAEAFMRIPGAKIIGFCDNGSGKSKILSKKYRAKSFENYQGLINDPEVTIVTIATPSGAHMEPCLAAAKAGKHVLCEKPIEILPERIDKMIDAHKESGTYLGGIFNFRFDNAITPIKDAIETGRFGKIIYAAAHVPWWRNDEYYENSWHGTWKLDGGGALMNQSIHMIDLLQYLMGEVEVVKAFANSSRDYIEVEDHAVAVMKFKNGCMGTVTGTTASFPGRNRKLEITGTCGTVEMVEDRITFWEFKQSQPEDKNIIEQYGKPSKGGGFADPAAISSEGHYKNILSFVEAIEENKSFEIDGNEARKAVDIIRRIYEDAGIA